MFLNSGSTGNSFFLFAAVVSGGIESSRTWRIILLSEDSSQQEAMFATV
jgi:hypothetical protein